eukprot:CAMPEP_0170061076 /NCGR_PEP_ID=MMETSP0019_2-20121128/2782_1 /TAXON_ID=98059 /ORGANISM="Dinobryon sp., Strain UTEXLB2267" /LENGTH=104 /DNA_ID=CAMNT_0010266821 /DNA_START=27 /DNA_END=341 /DNA_ORIENTATION=+
MSRVVSESSLDLNFLSDKLSVEESAYGSVPDYYDTFDHSSISDYPQAMEDNSESVASSLKLSINSEMSSPNKSRSSLAWSHATNSLGGEIENEYSTKECREIGK